MMNLEHWDSMLNPLEVLWAYQQNTKEGEHPLDNPKGSLTHLTIPQSYQMSHVCKYCYQLLVLYRGSWQLLFTRKQGRLRQVKLDQSAQHRTTQ